MLSATAAVRAMCGEGPLGAQSVNSIFSLRALAALKMPQVLSHLRCHAAGKPALRARRSKTNPANSRTADGVDGSCINRRRNTLYGPTRTSALSRVGLHEDTGFRCVIIFLTSRTIWSAHSRRQSLVSIHKGPPSMTVSRLVAQRVTQLQKAAGSGRPFNF